MSSSSIGFAAFLGVFSYEGVQGVKSLLGKVFSRQRGFRLLALVLWVPIGIGLVAFLIVGRLEGIASGYAPMEILLMIPSFYMNIVMIGLMEELGWRGFVMSQLKDNMSVILLSLIIGIVKTLLYLPFYGLAGTYHYNLIASYGLLLTTLMSLLLNVSLSMANTYVYFKSGKGLLLPGIFYGSVTTILWLFGVGNMTFYVFYTFLWMSAALVFALKLQAFEDLLL